MGSPGVTHLRGASTGSAAPPASGRRRDSHFIDLEGGAGLTCAKIRSRGFSLPGAYCAALAARAAARAAFLAACGVGSESVRCAAGGVCEQQMSILRLYGGGLSRIAHRARLGELKGTYYYRRSAGML